MISTSRSRRFAQRSSLSSSPGRACVGVRGWRCLPWCTMRRSRFRFEPRLLFDGPIDSAVGAETAASVVATLREVLSNIARHANATVVDVELAVGDDLLLQVCDNGCGLPDPAPVGGHGLLNINSRAEALGGSAEFAPSAFGRHHCAVAGALRIVALLPGRGVKVHRCRGAGSRFGAFVGRPVLGPDPPTRTFASFGSDSCVV